MRLLVAGVGNVFLRDDAFGSEVVRRLPAGGLPDGVRAVDYGIRGMHLAYDLLAGWDALLLIDAIPDRGTPGTLHVLEVTETDLGAGEFDAHGMDPASVLAALDRIGGSLPRTVLVGCEIEDVGEGMGLSPAVAEARERAVPLVLAMICSMLDAVPQGVA